MVIGEVAIDLAVQRDHLATQRLDQLGRNDAGNPVAAVDHHLHRPGHGDVAADLLEIALQHIDLFDLADTAGQVVALDPFAQYLNLFVGQGIAGDDDLEAVVVRRVVTAGEHHPRFAGENVGRVVEHRGRHHADVADVAAAVEQALDQVLDQLRARQATVAANRNIGLTLGEALGPDGAADPVGGFGGQAVADNTTDVVGAEDTGGQIRGFGAAHCGFSLLRVEAEDVLVLVENVDVENIGLRQGRSDVLGRFGGPYGGGRGRCLSRSRSGGADGQSDHVPGQCVEDRQAQGRYLDGLARGEFLQQATDPQHVFAQLALLAAEHQLQADQYAGQCQQRRGDQVQGRQHGRRGLAARNVAQRPVGIAAGQCQGRGIARGAALQQYLLRCAGELLAQPQLPGFVGQRRECRQQVLEIADQQQRAANRLLTFAAQGDGAVQQPAVVDLVRFGGGRLTGFRTLQQIERGEVQRSRTAGVGYGAAADVQMGVDHAGQVQQALLGIASTLTVATQRVDQHQSLRHRLGIALQLTQRLLQRAGLALAPGAGQLRPLLLLGILQAQPEQRCRCAEADQAARQATEQGFDVDAAALAAGLGRVQNA